jgi:hypothetical protein
MTKADTHTTTQRSKRNVTARGIVAELQAQRRLAAREVARVLRELAIARRVLAEIDEVVAAVRAA